MPQAVLSARFSTADVDAPDRVELWEDYNARALVSLECRTLDGDALMATEQNVRLGAFDVARVEASAHVVERSARHVAACPGDDVLLYFSLRGESFFYHGDGVLLLRPGDLLVCDVNEPFARGFAKGLEELVLKVPRAAFQGLADQPRLERPMTFDFSDRPDANAHAAELARLAADLLAAGDRPVVEAQARALDLLHSLFSRDGASSPAAYRRAALRLIERHLSDPRLSVAQIAAGVGLSERQLSRVFQAAGTTPARTILERRLERAAELLLQSRQPAVGRIASQCGFASHAHFTRVFRERFGVRPSDYDRPA